MTRIEWLVDYICGPCTCGEEYTSRGLTSPQCHRCLDGEEARDALLLAYQLGHDENGECYAYDVIEPNRKRLAALLKQMKAGTEEEGTEA